MNGRSQPLLARLRRLARAAADGASVDPDRDARSIDADGRALIENLRVVAQIAGGCSPSAEDSPTEDAPRERPMAAAELARIGPYRIVGRLGEGGMGVVYVAEQTEPVRRHVALKLIKLGMDTRQVVARFESERQALALMNHPYIAQVFDAGTTDDGPALLRHGAGRRRAASTPTATGHRLTTRAAAASCSSRSARPCSTRTRRAIIHRDLKPSNILVTDHDGGPRPEDHRLRHRQGDRRHR